MAISKNNYGFTGKVGGEVTYILNGQMVKRRIGVTFKKATSAQLAVRQRTAITSKFLKSILDFIEIGFELEAKGTTKNQHNLASSYNNKNAIIGVFPNLEIDYQKVLLTSGAMPAVKEIKVVATKEGLEFTWDTTELRGMRWNDQVMVMAYFPEANDATFLVNGANRKQGSQLLKLSASRMQKPIETYISFVAANRKSIANSIYTGKFN